MQTPAMEPALVIAAPLVRPPRSRRAVLTLIIVATFVGETLGSFNTSPLAMLVNPAALPFNALIYGAAAIFIHEVVTRRRLGWASWVLLGIAYSALNEGVGAAQWFVPAVSTLPVGYGHALGVNWSWLPALAIFHTVYSMVIPIVFVESCFPAWAGRPWLGRRGFIAVTTILLGVGTLFCLIPLYQPGRLVAFAIVLALGTVAVWLPAMPPPARTVRVAPSLWRLRWAGFGLQVALFAVLYLAPRLLPPVITTVLVVAFGGWLIWRLRTWTTRADWSSRQSVALITGAFGLTLLLSFIPPVFLTGEGLAEIAWFVVLLRLAAYVKKRPLAATRDAVAAESQQYAPV